MVKSCDLVCVSDYENAASHAMSYGSFKYISRGAQTFRDSKDAFSRYRLRPRALRGAKEVNLSTTVLGQPIRFPVCIAPTAFQRLAHPCKERGSINAAKKHGTVMVFSSCASTHVNTLCQEETSGLLWMQMYFFTTQALTEATVRRAERAGFRALVVTIDSSGLAAQRTLERAPLAGYDYLRAQSGVGPINLDVVTDENREAYQSTDKPNHFLHSIYEINQSHATEEDILWLKSFTKLPIVLKGVLTAQTARKAVSLGIDGILVSAHGGRQLDGVPAPIDALSEVVEAVQGSSVEVYMDGGIRTGTDVLKALALGARAVFIGRPVIYGLAVKGQQGVEHILQILRDELELAMRLTGVSDVEQIPLSIIVKESDYLAAKL